MSNMKLLFTKSSTLDRKQRKKKKKLVNRTIGFSLIAIELITLIILVVSLLYLKMIPGRYIAIGVLIIILLTAYNVITQFTSFHIIGKILAVLLAIIMGLASFYVIKTYGMLGSVSNGSNIKTDHIEIIVLKDDKAESINDTADYTFGIHSTLDSSLVKTTVEDINKKLMKQITTAPYSDYTTLIDALYNGDIQAIIVNAAHKDSFYEAHPDFNEKTRVLDTNIIETEMNISTSGKDVTKDCYALYVSGNDQEGTLNSVGLSDVNIIVLVNPNTRQILLVNTPRDYYVNVVTAESGIGKDKLTHAGSIGMDSSILTLENLYGIDIDYYLRLNFTGAVDIIDAIGGITVNSEIDFTTHPDTSPVKYHFTVGPNECDGEKALAFVRERQNIAGGDNQRGRDQMIAIQAMIDKVTSPSILYNYAGLMDTISGLVQTNMPTDDIAAVVRSMLDDPTPWNVQHYNVKGSGDYNSSFFFGYTTMYVTNPDYNTVNIAIDMISKVIAGEIFNADEYSAAAENAAKGAASSAK